MPRLTKLGVAAITVSALAVATPALALATNGSDEPVRAEKTAEKTASSAAPDPQSVLAGSVLFARTTSHRETPGTRSNQEFFEISRTGDNDVPAAALAAYRRAVGVMAKEQPSCGIRWTLLAAIGRVESNHGRFAGAQLSTDGVSRPAIRGPQLDGAGDFAAISDSDGGRLDGDRVWDRAVGPMQFLPSTWRAVGRDGDGDGRANPDDLDDAALGSAVYLCGAGGSLAETAGMSRAAFRYNHSDYYVQLVLSFARGYETGVFAEPSPPPPAPQTRHVKHVKQAPSASPAKQPTHPSSTPTPSPSKTPTTAAQTPTPAAQTPTPAPDTSTPTPTSPTDAPAYDETGMLTKDDLGEYLLTTDTGQVTLEVADTLDETATTDFDGDGIIETNAGELDGLVANAQPVHLQGTVEGSAVTPTAIDDQPYQPA